MGVSTTGGRTEWRAELARELVPTTVGGGGGAGRRFVASYREASPEAVLGIGPLTNVAALLALGIEVPRLTLMGGALRPSASRPYAGG